MPSVKKFYSLSLFILAVSSQAFAADSPQMSQISCTGFTNSRSYELSGSEGQPLVLTTHQEILLTSPVLGQPERLATQWKLEAGASPGKFQIVNENGRGVGELELLGQSTQIGIVRIGDKNLHCRFRMGAESAEERAYQAAIQAWKKFKAKQPKPCDLQHDSKEFIQEARPKVTVVFFQGYAISPANMLEFREMFAQHGYNVLMPRLKGHYNREPRDLDRITAEEWIQQSEEVLKIAGKMSPKVVVAGYSLGGLIASRLALLHPKQVSALLAFSPAWRTTTRIRAGSAIGSLFGISANEFFGATVRACSPYISAPGGREVERVSDLAESEAGTTLGKFAMPSLVANIVNDDTVDASFIEEARAGQFSKRNATVTFNAGNHLSWLYAARTMTPDRSPFRGPMDAQVKAFLQFNKLLE